MYLLLWLSLQFLAPFMTHAQWKEMHGPEGGFVTTFAKSRDYIFAGTQGGGVFRSLDNGLTWQYASDGLTGRWIESLVASDGGILIAATMHKGVFRSKDNGTNWVSADSGLPEMGKATIGSLFFNEDTLHLWVSDHVYLSINNGVSWQLSDSELDHLEVVALTRNGKEIIAAGHKGVFVSENNGQKWTNRSEKFSHFVLCVAVYKNKVFAGTYGRSLFTSFDSCRTWHQIATDGLIPYDASITCIATIDSTIIIGTDYAIFTSKDFCKTWVRIGSDRLGFTKVNCLMEQNGVVFAGTENGVLCSMDGEKWTWRNSGFNARDIWDMALFKGTLLTCGNNGVYSYDDSLGIFREANNGLVYTNQFRTVHHLVVSDTNIYANNWGRGFFLSTNGCKNWTEIHSNHFSNSACIVANAAGGEILAGGWQKIYRHDSTCTPWEPWKEIFSGLKVYTSGEVSSIIVKGDTLCALLTYGMDTYDGVTSFHIIRSSDNGSTWDLIDSGLPKGVMRFLEADDRGTIYTAIDSVGIFSSGDNGTKWERIGNNLTDVTICSFTAIGDTLLVGTDGCGIFIQEKRESDWKPVGEGVENIPITSFVHRGDTLIIGTGGSSVWWRLLSEITTRPKKATVIASSGSSEQKDSSLTVEQNNQKRYLKIKLPIVGIIIAFIIVWLFIIYRKKNSKRHMLRHK